MFEQKYFVNPSVRNQIVLTDFGRVVFRNHIAFATNQTEYDFLKKYPECFEIDKEKYLADEEQLTNYEIFKKTIENYRIKEEPKVEKKVEVKVEAEAKEEPVAKKGGRKPKQA